MIIAKKKMTFDDVVSRLRALGFACIADDLGDNRKRAKVGKLVGTPGNRCGGEVIGFSVDEDDGRVTDYEVYRPCPMIWERDGRYEFEANEGVPTSPGAYIKILATAEELYEEVVHYFFDATSRMRLEDGFVPGSGRPPGA